MQGLSCRSFKTSKVEVKIIEFGIGTDKIQALIQLIVQLMIGIILILLGYYLPH